jgi:hypothetical protein
MNELVTFCPKVMGKELWANRRMGWDGMGWRKEAGRGCSRRRDEEDEINGE